VLFVDDGDEVVCREVSGTRKPEFYFVSTKNDFAVAAFMLE